MTGIPPGPVTTPTSASRLAVMGVSLSSSEVTIGLAPFAGDLSIKKTLSSSNVTATANDKHISLCFFIAFIVQYLHKKEVDYNKGNNIDL
jgi:hypothetical protein